ncbi:hypothetical protein G6F37_005136 [Rhizopus arrhizus]|nr:hypothetical protein G6F38_002795 [Rhizopus arrhizus]KAG1159182.1 hypothetical protein G6F37_005136 [Rhizopus arrhizus]
MNEDYKDIDAGIKHLDLDSPSSNPFRLSRKYTEADMSDFDFSNQSSSSQPNETPKTTKRVSLIGQDITDNGGKYLMMEPVDLNRFRKWMVGFCIVNFDLEIGQALDYVYPPMDLSVDEQKNICFSAFPDSNVFEVGDQVFSIRVKASTSKFAVSGPTADAGFLYGYVFFRQKKDSSIRRGYFQKSLVLLSQHPFVGLFSRIVSILGPAFFDTGQPMLEAACMNIVQW